MSIEQPFRIVWHCPNCETRHEAEGPLIDVLAHARYVLEEGGKMLAIYNGGYAAELDLDDAEQTFEQAKRKGFVTWFKFPLGRSAKSP